MSPVAICLHPAAAFTLVSAAQAAGGRPPNVVYIMSDELAYFELGHMGNPYIKTPHIDRFAAEGMRFTHAYAGSPVCAPLRCNLMTGKHAGHASVRANDGGTPLRAGEPTIASLLKAQGYATGGFGKWGCGGRDSTGVPEEHGFDTFFGYYDQVHAHSFYPPYLIHNSEEVPLPGNVGGRSGETYSHYEIMHRGLDFIRAHKDRPFFAYFPITPPHGMYDIPADDPAWDSYAGEAWMQDETIPQDVKNYAAMVTMVDNDLGTVLALLRELELEENTIVFFTGDNGGQDRFRSKQHPRGFFGPNVDPGTGTEFRGGKGNLFEGGLRIPYLARWPGRIAPGMVSDLVFYHPDVLPTLCELCGAATSPDTDGLSFLPTLLGQGEQTRHEFLYWESGSQVAVRSGSGNWKAVKAGKAGAWELYDLAADPSETEDRSADHGDLLKRMQAFAAASHTPAEPGTYTDRSRHERDRWAKWGTAKDAPKPKGAPQKPSGQVHRIEGAGLVPQERVKVHSASSENAGNQKFAVHAIDTDPLTLWHTRFADGVREHPHEIILDLGAPHAISSLHYLARQDGGWNGAFAETEIYVAASADTFPDRPALTTAFAKTKAAQRADLPTPVVGRFVKLRILSEVNGGPWASAAEIAVAGERE